MASTGKAIRLFVGNLPWSVGSRELRKYFSEFGYVVTANVIFDRNTGISRNYGFVTLGNPSAYNAVRDNKIHVLEGQTLLIRPAV